RKFSKGYCFSKTYNVFIFIIIFNNNSISNHIFKMRNSRFNKCLFFFSRIILRVLRQIPEVSSRFNSFHYLFSFFFFYFFFLILSTTSFLFTVFKSCNSFSTFSFPSSVMYLLFSSVFFFALLTLPHIDYFAVCYYFINHDRFSLIDIPSPIGIMEVSYP